MKPVKLLTPWFGPLPAWLPQFQERLAGSALFDWELVQPDPGSLRWAASVVASAPCRKADGYPMCDLRPLFWQMFKFRYDTAPWWGWCDLDIVLGDVDRLLGPFLKDFDVVTLDAKAVAGPFTILRNKPAVIDLWRATEDYRAVLNNPDYCNWDETGFAVPGSGNANPSFDKLLKDSGLAVHRDERAWTETQDMLRDGTPGRGCQLDGDRLIETPTGRELAMYHFTKQPKRWPLPDRDVHRQGERLANLQRSPTYDEAPEETPAYWARRLAKVKAEGLPLHVSVIDATQEQWDAIQAHTAGVLRMVLKLGDRVLDAGCSYGAMVDTLPAIVTYIGADYCPDMVQQARELHLSRKFFDADLTRLPFSDGTFNWAVCRGVEGTIKTLLGAAAWDDIQRELLRVAKRLLLIDMSRNSRVVEQT